MESMALTPEHPLCMSWGSCVLLEKSLDCLQGRRLSQRHHQGAAGAQFCRSLSRSLTCCWDDMRLDSLCLRCFATYLKLHTRPGVHGPCIPLF